MTTPDPEPRWRCPQGHAISGADVHDMWCDTCGGDVIAIANRTDPPEYEPDEDALAARYQAAMTMKDPHP